MYDITAVRDEVEELLEKLDATAMMTQMTQQEFDDVARDLVSLLLSLVRLDAESPDDNFIDFVEHYTWR